MSLSALVQYFIQKTSREMKLLPHTGPGTIDHLMVYYWPCNVRELENAVERVLIQSQGNPQSVGGFWRQSAWNGGSGRAFGCQFRHPSPQDEKAWYSIWQEGHENRLALPDILFRNLDRFNSFWYYFSGNIPDGTFGHPDMV